MATTTKKPAKSTRKTPPVKKTLSPAVRNLLAHVERGDLARGVDIEAVKSAVRGRSSRSL